MCSSVFQLFSLTFKSENCKEAQNEIAFVGSVKEISILKCKADANLKIQYCRTDFKESSFLSPLVNGKVFQYFKFPKFSLFLFITFHFCASRIMQYISINSKISFEIFNNFSAVHWWLLSCLKFTTVNSSLKTMGILVTEENVEQCKVLEIYSSRHLHIFFSHVNLSSQKMSYSTASFFGEACRRSAKKIKSDLKIFPKFGLVLYVRSQYSLFYRPYLHTKYIGFMKTVSGRLSLNVYMKILIKVSKPLSFTFRNTKGWRSGVEVLCNYSNLHSGLSFCKPLTVPRIQIVNEITIKKLYWQSKKAASYWKIKWGMDTVWARVEANANGFCNLFCRHGNAL